MLLRKIALNFPSLAQNSANISLLIMTFFSSLGATFEFFELLIQEYLGLELNSEGQESPVESKPKTKIRYLTKMKLL